MTITDTAQQPEPTRRGASWGIPVVIGILLIIGGAFALAYAVVTSVVSIIYIGVMLLVLGVLEIIAAIRLRHTGPHVAFLPAGLLAIVVGIVFINRPLASLASVTLLIAGYMFARGLFRGVTAIVDRYDNWGWDLAYAIVAVAIGIYIVAAWPLSAAWLLGTLVAAEIIARGFTLIAAGFAIRDLEHGAPTGPTTTYAAAAT